MTAGFRAWYWSRWAGPWTNWEFGLGWREAMPRGAESARKRGSLGLQDQNLPFSLNLPFYRISSENWKKEIGDLDECPLWEKSCGMTSFNSV